MEYNSIDAAIIDRFASNFNTTEVLYPNMQNDKNRSQPYVRITVNKGDSPQVSMGGADGNIFRQFGIIVIQIYDLAGKGTKLVNDVATEVAAIWRNKHFSGIVCGAPSFNDIGEIGGWYQVNVSCEFYFDYFE